MFDSLTSHVYICSPGGSTGGLRNMNRSCRSLSPGLGRWAALPALAIATHDRPGSSKPAQGHPQGALGLPPVEGAADGRWYDHQQGFSERSRMSILIA